MSQDVLELFERAGAILQGHFQLTSGRHSGTYLEKFQVLQSPERTAALCSLIAERFADDGVTLVAGPTTGGIILAYETARQLNLRYGQERVRGIFAERAAGGEGRVFGRGFAIRPGERTLVVDDILTTGGSIRDVIRAVQEAGAEPLGVGVLVDRSGGTVDFGLPLFGCLSLQIDTFPPEDCPLCRQGLPLKVT